MLKIPEEAVFGDKCVLKYRPNAIDNVFAQDINFVKYHPALGDWEKIMKSFPDDVMVFLDGKDGDEYQVAPLVPNGGLKTYRVDNSKREMIESLIAIRPSHSTFFKPPRGWRLDIDGDMCLIIKK